jgi:hypothetical protein
VLAYVFWHRAAPLIERADFESALARFHAALAEHPPPGFRGSAAFRVAERTPWVPGFGPAYEDWYLVEDWVALGALNEAAVAGPRHAPHDAVAGESLAGAGGVYGLMAGAATPHARHARWLAKLTEVSREDFDAALLATGASVWMRQMVLGPAPEYVVRGPDPIELRYPSAPGDLEPVTPSS